MVTCQSCTLPTALEMVWYVCFCYCCNSQNLPGVASFCDHFRKHQPNFGDYMFNTATFKNCFTIYRFNRTFSHPTCFRLFFCMGSSPYPMFPSNKYRRKGSPKKQRWPTTYQVTPQVRSVGFQLEFGDGQLIPPLMTGILIMGPYKPLRNWVNEFNPLLYANIGGLSNPGKYISAITLQKNGVLNHEYSPLIFPGRI